MYHLRMVTGRLPYAALVSNAYKLPILLSKNMQMVTHGCHGQQAEETVLIVI